MEIAKEVINIRGTLAKMHVGSGIILRNVRGSYIRNCASVLRGDYGMKFRVHKIEGGFEVTREA